jgi:hypothetical protein
MDELLRLMARDGVVRGVGSPENEKPCLLGERAGFSKIGMEIWNYLSSSFARILMPQKLIWTMAPLGTLQRRPQSSVCE